MEINYDNINTEKLSRSIEAFNNMQKQELKKFGNLFNGGHYIVAAEHKAKAKHYSEQADELQAILNICYRRQMVD